MVSSARLPTWLESGLLALVIGCALYGHTRQIGESLWLDELHTAWVVSAGWQEIAERAQLGNQSPLYFYLPWGVMRVAGASEWSLRIPSLLANVAMMGLAGALVATWTGNRVLGWWAAAFVALDGHSIFYAQEARPYAWVQLIGLTHLGSVFWLDQRPSPRNRVLLIGVRALLFYLHYTAALLLTGEALFWLTRQRTESAAGYRRREYWLDLFLTGLLCLPAWPHVQEVLSRRAQWAEFIPRPGILALITLFPLGVYLVVPLLARLPGIRERPMSPAVHPFPMRAVQLLACWFLTPLCLAWLATRGDLARLYFARYLVGIAVAPALLGALLLCGLTPPRRWGVGSLVLAAAMWQSGILTRLQSEQHGANERRQGWRAAIAFLNQQRAPGEPVYLASGLVETDRLDALRQQDDWDRWQAYLQFPVRGLYPLHVEDSAVRLLPWRDWLPLDESVRNELQGTSGSWFLVNSGRQSGATLAAALETSLADNRRPTHVPEWRSFGDVHVLRVLSESQ